MNAKIATCLCLLGFAGSALADVVHLKDGRTLDGLVVDEGDRYAVVDRDRKFVASKNDVARVEEAPSFMEEYRRRLDALPADDAEAIYEFGRWLEDNDWASRAQRAYEEVLTLDADHRGARRRLGYRLFEGEWVSPEELNRRNGLVEFEGRWYVPHDLAQLQHELATNERMKEALEHQRNVNRKLNGIMAKFATFDKQQRKNAYEELSRYADELNSPEIRKLADDARAYYDHLVKVLCAKMRARTEIHATHTKLRKPIETFQTNLGQSIAFFSGQSPVRIQLPEISIAEVHTTVDLPAGCD